MLIPSLELSNEKQFQPFGLTPKPGCQLIRPGHCTSGHHTPGCQLRRTGPGCTYNRLNRLKRLNIINTQNAHN